MHLYLRDCFFNDAILSVMSTMNRFVRQQRVQIGTLKALGFKNRKIYIHYIEFGLSDQLDCGYFRCSGWIFYNWSILY